MSYFIHRSKHALLSQIKSLVDEKDKANSGAFTLHEDIYIMSHVLCGKKPLKVEEFKQISDHATGWKHLASSLDRSIRSCNSRWRGVLEPAILCHFYGVMDVDSRKDFFQFLIDAKVVAAANIEWDKVLAKFPWCTRAYLNHFLSHCTYNLKKTPDLPLHELVSNHLSVMRSTHKKKIAKRYQIAQAFDELRGVKPMSTTTKEALKKFTKQESEKRLPLSKVKKSNDFF